MFGFSLAFCPSFFGVEAIEKDSEDPLPLSSFHGGHNGVWLKQWHSVTPEISTGKKGFSVFLFFFFLPLKVSNGSERSACRVCTAWSE